MAGMGGGGGGGLPDMPKFYKFTYDPCIRSGKVCMWGKWHMHVAGPHSSFCGMKQLGVMLQYCLFLGCCCWFLFYCFHLIFRAGMMWVFMAQNKFQLLILTIWQTLELSWTTTMCHQFAHQVVAPSWLENIRSTQVFLLWFNLFSWFNINFFKLVWVLFFCLVFIIINLKQRQIKITLWLIGTITVPINQSVILTKEKFEPHFFKKQLTLQIKEVFWLLIYTFLVRYIVWKCKSS